MTKKEIWKPLPGYEKWYDISSHGGVRSYHLNNSSGLADRSIQPHPMALSYSKSFGYWFIGLSRGVGVVKTHTLHILVAKAFVANPHKRKYVHHLDNDKLNPCAWNLKWVTAGENQEYAYADGRRKRPDGTLNGRSKLTVDQVLEIFRSDENHYKLASIYGVGRGTISDIKSGFNWSSITGKKYQKSIPVKKLSPKEIIEIANSKLGYKEISNKYGITPGRVSNIKTGRSCSNITKIKFTGKREYFYFGLKSSSGQNKAA